MFNKEEFIAAYAEKAEITKAEAGRRIEEICGVWLEMLLVHWLKIQVLVFILDLCSL